MDLHYDFHFARAFDRVSHHKLINNISDIQGDILLWIIDSFFHTEGKE